jgi:hypothetical protein
MQSVEIPFVQGRPGTPEYVQALDAYLMALRTNAIHIHVADRDERTITVTVDLTTKTPNYALSSETIDKLYDEMVFPLCISICVGNRWVGNRVISLVASKENRQMILEILQEIMAGDFGDGVNLSNRYGSTVSSY